jgi:hypothetical protein
MRRFMTTVAMTIGMMFATQAQQAQFETVDMEEYGVGSYEWYHFDEDPDLYMIDGSRPSIKDLTVKAVGQTVYNKPAEKGYITDGVYYMMWKHVTVDGRDAFVMLVEDDFGSKLSVGFYNGGGAPNIK